jgi:hypothetical protein
MDAFAHMRIRKGRVLVHVEGNSVKIQVKGMMVNETINIEVEDCSTVDIQGNYKMLDKRDDESQRGFKVQPPERPTAVPPAPPPSGGAR